MKKITFLLLFFSLLLFGQPVLNSSDVLNLDISSIGHAATSSTITAGLSGANQAWDFSNLNLMTQGNSTTTYVLTAPYASSFPTANYYVNTIYNAINNFVYYKLTSNKLEVLGSSDSTGITSNFINPNTVFVFPFAFNTVLNDTYQLSTSPAINSKVTTYDAYGTVITAFGTFNNVIRLKEIVNNSDIYYSWFQTNPYRSIVNARAYVNSGNTVYFSVYQPTNLGITQNSIKSNFSIYPNPTAGDFTINYDAFANREVFVNVYDILGNQIIKNEKIDSNSKNINSSDFDSGLYLIKITDSNNEVLYSDKIIKK
jgi:hypothetical protein